MLSSYHHQHNYLPHHLSRLPCNRELPFLFDVCQLFLQCCQCTINGRLINLCLCQLREISKECTYKMLITPHSASSSFFLPTENSGSFWYNCFCPLYLLLSISCKISSPLSSITILVPFTLRKNSEDTVSHLKFHSLLYLLFCWYQSHNERSSNSM